jgi:hypothetical protein
MDKGELWMYSELLNIRSEITNVAYGWYFIRTKLGENLRTSGEGGTHYVSGSCTGTEKQCSSLTS